MICRRRATSHRFVLALAAALTSASLSGCGTKRETAAARIDLQAALDAVVREYPETGDLDSYLAKRVDGRNGWDALKALADRWHAVREDKRNAGWATFWHQLYESDPAFYDDEARKLLSKGLAESEQLASDAAALLAYDCIVRIPRAPLENIEITPLINLSTSLKSRMLAKAALSYPNEEIADAALLQARLAMKLDSSWSFLDGVLTHAIRITSMRSAIEIAGRFAEPQLLLDALADIRESRLFTPREVWTASTAQFVSWSREYLKSTHGELVVIAREIYMSDDASPARLLRETATEIRRAAAIFKAMPDQRMDRPARIAPLVDAYIAAAKGSESLRAEPHYAFVQLLINSELEVSMARLELAIRIHEARTGAYPDRPTQAQLLEHHPGLRLESDGAALIILATDDHPLRRLSVDGIPAISTQKLQPRSKP